MSQIANESGVKTRALLTDMNVPLGRAAGNWLEVKESVRCLEDDAASDLRELVIDCAAHLLVLTEKLPDVEWGRARALQVLASGAPRRKWEEMLRRQGADLDAFHAKLRSEHTAPVVVEVKSAREGFLARVDARILGEVIRDLGGGRMTREADVDFEVGVDQLTPVGQTIEDGAILCRVHARTQEQAAAARSRLEAAFEISLSPVAATPRVIEVL
jgi:thymidine phosphorylase